MSEKQIVGRIEQLTGPLPMRPEALRPGRLGVCLSALQVIAEGTTDEAAPYRNIPADEMQRIAHKAIKACCIPTGSPFVEYFHHLQMDIHATACEKGWWDKPRNDGELLMLMVTELAEACEALRHGNPPDDKVPQFSRLEAELADVVIRIMDFAEARGLRLAEAIEAKAHMNKTRERMHGGKQF